MFKENCTEIEVNIENLNGLMKCSNTDFQGQFSSTALMLSNILLRSLELSQY